MLSITKTGAVAALAILIAAAATPMAIAQSTDTEGAAVEETIETNAVVRSVNAETRQVELELEDGRVTTIVAGDEVRNFDQIEPGDKVKAVHTRAVAAALSEATETGPAEAAIAEARAAEGDKPAGLVASAVGATVEFLSYDSDTHVVTFNGADGMQRSLEIQTDEMRAFAETLSEGDKVDVVFVEALAIGIVEE